MCHLEKDDAQGQKSKANEVVARVVRSQGLYCRLKLAGSLLMLTFHKGESTISEFELRINLFRKFELNLVFFFSFLATDLN